MPHVLDLWLIWMDLGLKSNQSWYRNVIAFHNLGTDLLYLLAMRFAESKSTLAATDKHMFNTCSSMSLFWKRMCEPGSSTRSHVGSDYNGIVNRPVGPFLSFINSFNSYNIVNICTGNCQSLYTRTHTYVICLCISIMHNAYGHNTLGYIAIHIFKG